MLRAVLRSKAYRTLVLVVVTAVALTATITLLGNRADAALTTAFSSRFEANVNGSILLRGNTNMLCPPSATGCTAGQDGLATGTNGSLNNNAYVMEYADADNDPATFNDSTATIGMPAGSKVLFAGLYWSADTSAGGNGVVARNAADRGTVKFRTPVSAWQPVTASKVFTNSNNAAYQGFADVTALVSGAGNGVYSVADIQAGTGKDRYAGWALAIAYQNAAEPMHSLRIFDGFGVVSSSDTSVVIPVTGFETPQSGTVHASIGTVVYEGDLGLTGDTLTLDNDKMSDAVNPEDNFFNSTVSQAGTLINNGRAPGNKNLMGVDIDQFDASGKLNNSVNNAKLTLTTGGETFYPGVVTFTTDLFAPDVVTTMTGTDVDGGDLLPGDVIEYRIAVRNDGTDVALNTVLSNAIPTHTTYVPGTLKVEGAARTDAAGDDTAQFAGGTATFGVGTAPTGTAGGSLAHNETSYVTFRVKVDTDTPAGFTITNVANSSYTAKFTGMAISGTPAATGMTVQQPKADLSVAVAVSPATVQRAAAPNPVAYTVVVTNNGTDLEPAAKAELTLPTGVTAGSLPSGCTLAGSVVTCAAGTLLAGSQATFTIPAVAGAGAAPSAVATAKVSGAGADVVTGNNTGSAALRVNAAPVAGADTASTTNGVPVSIDVRANDSDPDDARSDLTVTLGTPPAHGHAVVEADGTVTYTPTLGWAGADSFTYTVSDGHGAGATATVTVTTANAAPVANDDTRSTPSGTRIDIPVLGNDSDPNNNPIHVDSITQPQAGAGTATLTGDVVSYTPAAGFTGTATFTYVVEDSLGGRSTGQIKVLVGNAKPHAADDVASVVYRGSVTIDVLANDTDANGDTRTIQSVGPPDHGTATITGGQIVYQAPAGFSGDATFTYVVTDGADTDTATVVVTVGNATPTAADQSVHTAYDTAVRIDALTGANDPNGDTLTVFGFTTPAHGSVAKNADGTLTYTPVTGWSGTDTFDFTIDDGRGGTDTKKITVVVTNGAPVARPDSVTVPGGTVATIDVLANDNDPNNDPLTVTIDAAPAHGTATVGTDGKVTYTPAAGYLGADSFHYTVTDGRGGQAGATVTVGVINTAPVARDDAVTTDTDTAVVLTPLGNDTDLNGDTLQVTAVTAAAHGTAVLAAGNTVTYTPRAGWFGTDTFTYSISDGHGGTASALVRVTVRNAAPIAVDDRFTVRPGLTTVLDLLANDRDPNTGQALSIATLGTPGKGTVTRNADGTVSYRPNALTGGIDTFTYVLTDDLGATDTGTVTVVIDAAPTATADTATAAAGTAVDIPVTGNDTDPEGGALTLVSVSAPAHGTATVVDGKVRYLPAAGFSGADTFTYVVRDAAGNTATGTVTVTVANAAPVAQDDNAAVLAGKRIDLDVLVNDTDANTGQTLTVTAVGTPAHGTASVVGGKIRYTARPDYAGPDTFTYTISDGHGGTAQATVTVTVSSGAAVAVPDERTTPYCQPVTVPVLANDLDPEHTLKLTAVTPPDHGTATIVGNQVKYTPPADFTGVAKFSYTAVDGDGNHVTTTVTVTVGAPPVVPDKALKARPGQAVKITLPTTDEHGVPVTVRSIGRPKHGTAKLNADDTVTYIAAKGFSGTDTFTYEAVDANGNVAEGTITIKVAGVNTAPVATNDAAKVDAGDSVVIALLKNDKDANADTLKVVKIGKPRHGTAVLNKDGTVTYAPFKTYAGGVDSFPYTISDGHGGTATAIVTVTVNEVAAHTGDGKLAKTGLDVISVVAAGGVAVLVGGFLLMAGGIPILGAPGRHRPGRHRG
ncbi:Ig-like domain-containing protein [Actinoplanes sp. TRM 88003]|uniref:Ig-like domain-containing protein n=1 Tax=Paractinoplanes aksuensis TaxID=2939490 RepID=A0ABT1DPC4_9ACTN|nr:Ig-like domain-containing protein [Actinoplanes aksuensis]MCO8272675.1 Ig-like domain-containing protein [Actinoplanes aksuensis]